MSPPQTLAPAMREWAHIFMRRSMSDFVRFAREAGLSMQQFSALLILQHRGAQGVSDLGEHLGVSSAAASQMIDRLVQQGLLSRDEDPSDRRVRQVALTARGKELIDKSMQARRAWIDGLARVLTPEEQQAIAAALGRLADAARELEQQS
jgi:DNA-binding MarR family transcriptional regulator